MAEPPAKKSKESTTISMVVEQWKNGPIDQFSPVHRINGFPWRLRYAKDGAYSHLIELICDMSKEAELWMCSVAIETSFGPTVSHKFKSWNDMNYVRLPTAIRSLEVYNKSVELTVEIKTTSDGQKWTRRPFLEPFAQRDGVLVIGKEKKRLYVIKQSLASQSSFFDRRFFRNTSENNMTEISIRDVEYEEFSNIMNMLYNLDGATLNDGNVHRVMQLANRFQFKIVKGRVVNYLLSSSSSLSIHEKLLMSEQYNHTLLKSQVISLYTMDHLKELTSSDNWSRLSKGTTKAVMKRSCKIKFCRPSSQSVNHSSENDQPLRRTASPPPATKDSMISMVIERWKNGQEKQFSPVHRINGYSWRLELCNNKRRLIVHCDKSIEAALWQFTAAIKVLIKDGSKGVISSDADDKTFNSWDGENNEAASFQLNKIKIGLLLEVEIKPKKNEDKWRLRPTLDESKPRDGVLVIGEEKKKIEVNKESLASLSPFFDRLFFGLFKENEMNEIPIGDVEYEEFNNIILMTYVLDGASLTDENLHRVLQLADRFELKIVEDIVVNYLLSSSSSFSIHEKLILSEQYNIPFLKDVVVSRYTKALLKKLSDCPEWDLLSNETTRILVDKSRELTPYL